MVVVALDGNYSLSYKLSGFISMLAEYSVGDPLDIFINCLLLVQTN